MTELRSRVESMLVAAGCVAADEEAEELVLLAAGDAAKLEAMLQRRLAGEPFAWVTGRISFCGIEVLVHEGVYVPRLQSEALVRRAAEVLPAGGTAVDLCTGSGALAAALAHLSPGAHLLATDVDERAVACAIANGVETFIGDLDEPLSNALAGAVDVLIGVVPYVPTAELVFLPRDVRDYEPLVALDGGADGTALLRRAIAAAARLLTPEGVGLLELGGDEVELLEGDLSELGFAPPVVLYDDEDDVRGIEIRWG